jgi:hypothetical protein
LALAAHSTPVDVAFAALTVCTTVLAIRVFRASVEIDNSGVRVVGLVRSHSLPWEDIEAFESRALPDRETGVVCLRNGRVIAAYALMTGQKANDARRQEVRNLVQRCNDALQQATSGVVAASGNSSTAPSTG